MTVSFSGARLDCGGKWGRGGRRTGSEIEQGGYLPSRSTTSSSTTQLVYFHSLHPVRLSTSSNNKNRTTLVMHLSEQKQFCCGKVKIQTLNSELVIYSELVSAKLRVMRRLIDILCSDHETIYED